MTHVLCHSLMWSEHHNTRCKAMLYRLKDICEEHKAIIVLLGDVVARRVNIQSIVELKEMLSDIPIHIVPAHEYDRSVCALLDIPCHVDEYLDDVFCTYDNVLPGENTYSAKERNDIPALFPRTSREYRRKRQVLLRTPEETRFIHFPYGPKLFVWESVDDDLSAVRGGDMLRLMNPTICHMRRCRKLGERGVRIQIVQQQRNQPIPFWDFFHSRMRSHPAKEAIENMLKHTIYPPVRIRFTYIRVENIGAKSFWLDASGSGIVWVGGHNGSGKTTLFTHLWGWLMLGIWRGQNKPYAVGDDAYAECKGTIDGASFRFERRIRQYEHVCRLEYMGVDETRNTPEETTMYFHERLLKWHGNSSRLYEVWMRQLMLKKDTYHYKCPHEDELRVAYMEVSSNIDRLKHTIYKSKKNLKDLEDIMERIIDVRARYEHVTSAWRRQREYQISIMQIEMEKLAAIRCVDPPGENPHDDFTARLNHIEQLREAYFQIVRRRRCTSLARHPETAYIKELRIQLEHARQEQDARRLQNCDVSERVDMHLIVEDCERQLNNAIAEANEEEKERIRKETDDDLIRISSDITEASIGIDEVYNKVQVWDKMTKEYMKYQDARARIHLLQERIDMCQEDHHGSKERMNRLSTILQRKRVEQNCLRMHIQELEQRLGELRACLYIDTLRNNWLDTWYSCLDSRATNLWHVAKWDESCSLHNGQLFRNGNVVTCSDGQDARRAICYFLAYKDIHTVIPYIVINHIDAYLDLDGRVGLERLIERWCGGDAIRTAWWLTRMREGMINMNGV